MSFFGDCISLSQEIWHLDANNPGVLALLEALSDYEAYGPCFLSPFFPAKHVAHLLHDYRLSPICIVGAIAHEYYACGNDNKRFLWRQAMCCVNVPSEMRLFVLSYRPDTCILLQKHGKKEVRQRQLIESLCHCPEDKYVIEEVFNAVRPTSETSVNYSEKLSAKHWQNAAFYPHFVYNAVVENRLKDRECLTERQSFDQTLRWRKCTRAQKTKHSQTWKIPAPSAAIDLRLCFSNIVSETNVATIRNAVQAIDCTAVQFTFENLDGTLNWFLFRLRSESLTSRLHRRAVQLFRLLMAAFRCRFVADYIVSLLLLQEHRYAAALLFEEAPVVFRSIIVDSLVPVYVPIMTPLQSFGEYYYTDERIKLSCDWPALRDVSVDLVCTATLTYSDEMYDTEHQVLYWNRVPEKDFFSRAGSALCVALDNSCNVSSCILLCVAKAYTVEWLSLDFGTGCIIRLNARDCLLDVSDADASWYSISLRHFRNHRDAVLYTRECEHDPMFMMQSFDFVHMALGPPGPNNVDVAKYVTVYVREFNVLRANVFTKATLL